MGDDFTSGMQHVQQGGSSYNLPSGSSAWQGALFQETMQANQATLDASAAARAKQSFGYVGGAGGSPVHLSFVSGVELLVMVVGGSLAVANLLSSINSVLGLIGFVGAGYAIVKLGGRVLRSRFARPVLALLSVVAWGLGGFVIASLIWPHNLVWQIVIPCGGLALAYFDKRAMFRRT
jgi:hypothetical protein